MNNEINILVQNHIKSKNKQKGNRPITCRLNPSISSNNYRKLENIPQSPKIKNNEYRHNSQPKLFSLIDIKDKYHSKTTSVPNQYKRKIYSNINKLLYNKNNEINKIPQIEYELIIDSKNKINNKSMLIIDKKEEKENIDNKNKLKKLQRNKSQGNIDSKDYRIQSALVSRKEKIYRPYFWDNVDNSEIKKKQRDIMMPKGYEFYEKNLKNLNQNYIKNNYVKRNVIKMKNGKNQSVESEHILIRKLNRWKQYQSDIFFLKGKENNEEKKNENIIKLTNNKLKNLYKQTESDIFNLKKGDKNIREKSGEYSYFRKLDKSENDKKVSYNMNNETLLGWKLRAPLPSLYNYSSTKYNLLNTDIKNIGNTKENIFNESKKISINYNPIHKQKSLCEFIDLCRVSAPNINNDYNKAIKENPNVFKRKNDISSEFFDIYNKYNSICDKPFQKFNPITGLIQS